MAIPPIISNLSIFKLFKSGNTSSAQASKSPDAKAPLQDKVEISNAALDKLSAEDVKKAGQTAVETKGLLEQDHDATLGLEPGFGA